MNDPDEWAQVVRMASRLGGNPIAPVRVEDPSILVRRVTNNVTLCGGPVEYFSKRRPVWVPPSPEDRELLPIDKLYGKYDDVTGSIEIYVRALIETPRFSAANPMNSSISFAYEHAHAVLHLGVTGRSNMPL
jgi:hypothetical protein